MICSAVDPQVRTFSNSAMIARQRPPLPANRKAISRTDLALPRQNQVRRDFAQRLEHEPPQVRARMRQRQFRRLANFVPETQSNPNPAGAARSGCFWAARPNSFSNDCNLASSDSGVSSARGSRPTTAFTNFRENRRTIHRRRLPERRFQDRRRRRKFAAAPSHPELIWLRIAEIRAKRDKGHFEFFSLRLIFGLH